MLAQALIEHGMLSSLAATIQRASVTVEDFFRGGDGKVVIGVAAVLMIVWLFRRR